jgi:dTDP-4-amino-4,6-dideoxygalactose transaminase
MIPYEDLKKANAKFAEELKVSCLNCIDSGWYILGKQVEEFEQNFAAFCQAKYCVGLASGLDALLLALQAESFEPGSEIIVPSNTYIATILAIVNAGLKPVLVEPDITTYNIDPHLLKAAIGPRTRGIMVVHLYGKSCQMDLIGQIAAEHGLFIFEDCAQSHGATFKGQMTGTFGKASAFSFYPTKNLGALGDAGALITNDLGTFERVKMSRNYGSRVKYHNEVLGVNSRLDELQAAILSVKLKYLDQINAHKRRLAGLYLAHLDAKKFVLPIIHPDFHDVYHIFCVRHPERDRLRAYLLSNGIGTEVHYPIPPHRQHAFQSLLGHLELPIAEEIHRTVVSLPISFGHTEDEINKVIEVMNSFC